MIPITLKKLATITHGVLQQINTQQIDNFWLKTITTNSNQQSIDGLFIALKGKYFDGHDFATEAVANGAISLLVDHKLSINCPQIIVKNTRIAMGKLAAWVRSQSKAKVIGITGSSGKTAVKNMVASILSQYSMTLFTDANFNNDIGVALTLFRLTLEYKYVVIEIGANHIGEIEYMTNIIKPNSVLVNNMYASHLEGFGSLAGVSKAKGEIFRWLNKTGTAVINLSSHNWHNWQYYCTQQQTVWRFSVIKQQQADFYAENISIKPFGVGFKAYTPTGITKILLPLHGKHNVANALAAIALSMSVGATLEQSVNGLETVKPVTGRLFPIYLLPGKLILDDTYNANPASMIAAANVLSKMPGYRILVIGDMSELGNQSKQYHQEVGHAIWQMKINCILSVGQQSAIISHSNRGCGKHFLSKQELIENLIPLIQEYHPVSVLIKGSRSTKMEEVVNAVQEHFLC
ncbi:UDP-N-acetylmuramoyl-tripeptide--D-alanyl-D-alanine ligase [Arsenophonus sp.]|uniref:UDP-N-acetylmuramoyl-tripeptide--D-alanyl-D- alanine ligase n=1 Tax=Arsenophonus sp. TaxID=1872640 RepID=UPI0028581466|nr:UDP-N-acetylmuramoyl-tripeptide--D-alanyl-D-alanine ligase [Arsenophonus sp.]MDR5615676.1 UDP-N-acetylmuramoyl-tripeptide--D-alanyl-D-alanine ligase [Arsenophonus sp.]